MKAIERVFEWVLWNSRFVTLVAVFASICGALAMFVVASLDVAFVMRQLWSLLGSGAADFAAVRAKIVTGVTQSIDGFLFALVLLIFALGIYELFISKIDVAERSEFAERILLIRSLDDLKERLAKVIFLILVVRYFEFALEAEVHDWKELLALAAGVVLIAIAIKVTKNKDKV